MCCIIVNFVLNHTKRHKSGIEKQTVHAAQRDSCRREVAYFYPQTPQQVNLALYICDKLVSAGRFISQPLPLSVAVVPPTRVYRTLNHTD